MTTRFRYPIRARLHWSLTLLIIGLSAMFALCMLLLVFWFERTLFYNHLGSDLEKYIGAYQNTEQQLVERQGDTTFYKLENEDDPLLPVHFRGYGEGNHEVLFSTGAFNVFVRYRQPWVYVLVQDQSEFERYEMLSVAGVIFGVLLIWVLGYQISRRIAGQILLPMVQLAAAVATPQRSGNDGRLDPERYPDDEVGLLAAAVDRYARQVQGLLEREQQFTADVSHELRTPMMAIQGACDLLKEGDAPTLRQTRLLQRIERSLVDMQNQMTLYLHLARAPESLDRDSAGTLEEIAQATLTLWQPQAKAKGLELRCLRQSAGHCLPVPQLLMAAVLNNLVRNALNHTDQGSVTIEVQANAIAVRDTGEGIDPAVADSIFVRGVRSTRGAGSRYGLGLSIAKRICDHQQWVLQVSENTPTGTVISVTVSALSPSPSSAQSTVA